MNALNEHYLVELMLSISNMLMPQGLKELSGPYQTLSPTNKLWDEKEFKTTREWLTSKDYKTLSLRLL